MILILDCGSPKTPFIADCVEEFMDFIVVPLLDFRAETIHEFKGVIVSGAPILVTETDVTPFTNALSWIKDSELPVLGICFGHQMIGILHGGFASRILEDRDWQTIEIFEESPLFNRLPHEISMMEDHCEAISIPMDFVLVASSDACVNEAMQHTSKVIPRATTCCLEVFNS